MTTPRVLAVLVLLAVQPTLLARNVEPDPPAASTTLRDASTFATIESRPARSVALFVEAGKVLQSPRCLNCHPVGASPTQTGAMRPHAPWVVRGADGHGVAAMRCVGCHGATNDDASNVPGQAAWALAPATMAWQGKSLGEICRQLKTPSRNGGRDLEAIVEHATNDGLVGWGWSPGGDRIPAPGTQARFGLLIRAWVDNGAACPS